jgi:hypothetical protein
MQSFSQVQSQDNSLPVYYYQAFGLIIESPLIFPELLPAEGTPAVTIRYGEVPDNLKSIHQQGVCYQVNSESFLFKMKGIAKYLVTGGAQIIIDPAPGVKDNEVRLFLLGSVFAALLQQQGRLLLHGCALEANGGATIFVGASGCGKSSLAGALYQRGFRILADDVCIITFSAAGEPLVTAAYPQLKLWADALTILGKNPEEFVRVRDGLEKYSLPLGDGFVNSSLSLQRVYELDSHNTTEFALTPLQGMNKLNVLLQNTYCRQFLAGPPVKKRHFEQCGQAARHCRVSRLMRPRRPFRLSALADLVEKEWT